MQSSDMPLPYNASAANAPAEQRGIDFILLFNRAMRYRWAVLAIMSLAALNGFIAVKTAVNIYKANALVLIEAKNNASQVGSAASMSMAGFSETMSPTEIEIIKSRRVMGNVVDVLSLTNQVSPVEQGLLGKLFAPISTQPVLVLDQLLMAPRLKGAVLKVTITGPARFMIEGEGISRSSGRVGVDYWLHDGAIRLRIKQLAGDIGQVFYLSQNDRLNTVLGLQGAVQVAERGRGTGVLEVSMTGANRVELERILNAVVEQLRKQSAGRAVAELSSSQDFLQLQLPKIKSDLYAAEDRLNQFQRNNQSIAVEARTAGTVARQADIETQLNELQLQESELKRSYKPSHPVYRALLDKRSLLLSERARALGESRTLPDMQQKLLRLKRDVEVNQQMYLQLLNQSQEVDVLKAGTIGNIRILDTAIVFPGPIAPNASNLMLMSLLVGVGLSFLLILLLEQLRRGVESPEQIEAIGMNVPAVIPLSVTQRRYDRLLRSTRPKGKHTLLAWASPDDSAIEALRGLRTSLKFRLAQASNQIVMLSGPAPGVGKSFISANLAATLAEGGQRILLIDGDLRRGYLHKFFNVPAKHQGLSDYLQSQDTPESYVNVTERPNLSVIPRGAITDNPSELLLSTKLQQLMEWASERFDLILIDSPPILAVTDAAIIGQLAGTTYIVARHKRVTLHEIEATVRRFSLSGIRINDCILNGLEADVGYGYGGYGYGGYYNYQYQKHSS